MAGGAKTRKDLTLQDLPTELWTIICNYCRDRDLPRLALCSKRCHEIVTPLVWKRVEVKFTTLESHSLTRKKTRHVQYTSELWFHLEYDYNEKLKLSARSNLKYLFQNCNIKSLSSVTFFSDGGSGEKVSWVLDELLSFEKLKDLHFFEVRFAGLSQLSRLKNLEELYFKLCDGIPASELRYLLQLPKLSKLTFCEDDQEDKDYGEVISKMVNLKELDLSKRYDLSRTDLQLIAQSLVNLQVLNIQGCFVTEYSIHCIATTMKQLRALYIAAWFNKFLLLTTEIFSDLSSMHTLKSLTMDGIEFYEEYEVTLPTSLEKLHLCHCRCITDYDIAPLCELPLLRELTLGYCNGITDEALNSLSKSESLRSLTVYKCPNLNNVGFNAISHIKIRRDPYDFCFDDCLNLVDSDDSDSD